MFDHAEQFLLKYDPTYSKLSAEELQQNQHRATYLINRYFTVTNHINMANTSSTTEDNEEDGIEQLAAYDAIEEALEQVLDESASEGDISEEEA